MIYKNKFENNSFEEKDFLNDLEVNKESIGSYMKLLILNEFHLTHTDVKILFHKKFPFINLKDKSLDTYIYYKYKEVNKINKERINNTESLFHIKDENNNELTEAINYKIDGNEEELKFVIIGTNEMLNNIQNNLIEKFFMEITYSCVPQNKKKFNLIVLCNYEIETNKTSLCSFKLR